MTNVFGLKKGLNGTMIKILAMVFMTIDHAGLVLFHNNEIMRIIGRLAFPLFAFMISEGCYYTRNKVKHFLTIFILGIICQVVYYFVDNSLYLSILITFSFSELLIFAYEYIKIKKSFFSVLIFVVLLGLTLFFGEYSESVLKLNEFKLDYGFFGAILPLLCYIFKDGRLKLLMFSIGTLAVSICLAYHQWWSLLTIPIIALYDGTKGKLKMKYFFYLYYPLHLVIIYGIGLII